MKDMTIKKLVNELLEYKSDYYDAEKILIIFNSSNLSDCDIYYDWYDYVDKYLENLLCGFDNDKKQEIKEYFDYKKYINNYLKVNEWFIEIEKYKEWDKKVSEFTNINDLVNDLD